MNFELKTLTLDAAARIAADALVVLVPLGHQAGDRGLDAVLGHTLQAADFVPKPGRVLSLYRPEGAKAARVLFVGVGDGSPRLVGQALGSALSALRGGTGEPIRLTVCLCFAPTPGAVQALVRTAAEQTYVYTSTKTKARGRKLSLLTLGVPDQKAVRTEFETAAAVVLGVELAKEWANRPANHATPTDLAGVARSLARKSRISCQVLGPAEVARLGMGAFMAVAQGSDQPLRFIVLKYQGASVREAPIVLIGKGITFDTGGISIKPAAEMDEMKFDMGGAASVLGVFRALAELQPDINVVGLIPSCENMPDGKAVKPGDVVTSMSGQTIEILNTDAEGRLILCDTLCYAERFKPAAVIDVATLTGACVIALGAVRSGLFSPDDALAQRLLQAGEAAQDLAWRLPLDDDYADGLKSNFADVANVAGRAGGAITAAKFLQRFAKAFPWAHLDIAGTAWRGGGSKGATGRPVGLLLEFLLQQGTAPRAVRKVGRTATVKTVRKSAAPRAA